MKAFTYLLPVLAAIASAGKVDECAGSCISKAIASTGCTSSDSHCICSSDLFLETVEKCKCLDEGVNAAATLAYSFCHEVGESTKRSAAWNKHSYSWKQKESRKERANRRSDKEQPAPETYTTSQPKSEHPIEDWFVAHPNYLINHPGWLNKHPNWAAKHHKFVKQHIPKDSPYWDTKPPTYTQYPQPPPNPHPTYTGKPTPTETCTTNKPSHTVW